MGGEWALGETGESREIFDEDLWGAAEYRGEAWGEAGRGGGEDRADGEWEGVSFVPSSPHAPLQLNACASPSGCGSSSAGEGEEGVGGGEREERGRRRGRRRVREQEGGGHGEREVERENDREIAERQDRDRREVKMEPNEEANNQPRPPRLAFAMPVPDAQSMHAPCAGQLLAPHKPQEQSLSFPFEFFCNSPWY